MVPPAVFLIFDRKCFVNRIFAKVSSKHRLWLIACTNRKRPQVRDLRPFNELGYLDSNQELTESESVALPFGDSPLLCQQWVFYMKTFHSSSTFSIFFRFFAKSFYRSSKNLDCTVQICKFNGLFPHQLCLSTGGIRKFLF